MSEHKPSTGGTWLRYAACVLVISLVGCTTAMPQAQVVPSVLQTEPPHGDFRTRLEDFFGKKPTERMN